MKLSCCLHTLNHDVDAFELASDVVTREVICVVVVGANVLHVLHSICGDEVDDLDVTEGHVEDLLMLVDPVDYLFSDVVLLW